MEQTNRMDLAWYWRILLASVFAVGCILPGCGPLVIDEPNAEPIERQTDAPLDTAAVDTKPSDKAPDSGSTDTPSPPEQTHRDKGPTDLSSPDQTPEITSDKPPGTTLQIEGTIHCKRCKNKRILVAALGDLSRPGETLLRDVHIAKAGKYTLTLQRPLALPTVHIIAFVDDNTDGMPDEPGKETEYAKNPLRPTSTQRQITGIDIFMDGPPSTIPDCKPATALDAEIPIVSSIKVDGDASDWQTIKPIYTSPKGPHCKGQPAPSHPGLDLARVWMARWDLDWYFAIELQGFFPNGFEGMRIELRFSQEPDIDPTKPKASDVTIALLWAKDGWTHAVAVGKGKEDAVGGAIVAPGNTVVEAKIPIQELPSLYQSYVWIRVLPPPGQSHGDQTPKSFRVEQQNGGTIESPNGVKMQSGILFVELAKGTTTQRRDQIVQSIGGKVVASVFSPEYIVVSIPGKTWADLDKAQKALANVAEVSSTFPSYIRENHAQCTGKLPDKAVLCDKLLSGATPGATIRQNETSACRAKRNKLTEAYNHNCRYLLYNQDVTSPHPKKIEDLDWPLYRMRFLYKGKKPDGTPLIRKLANEVVVRCMRHIKQLATPRVGVLESGFADGAKSPISHNRITRRFFDLYRPYRRDVLMCNEHTEQVTSLIAGGGKNFNDGAAMTIDNLKLNMYIYRCPGKADFCLYASWHHAIRNGVDVVNNSMGDTLFGRQKGFFRQGCLQWRARAQPKPSQSELFDTLMRQWTTTQRQQAIGELNQSRNRMFNFFSRFFNNVQDDRTVFFFSAGNDVSNTDELGGHSYIPSRLNNHIAGVGALGWNNQRTCFSSYGKQTGTSVPLWAPGGHMGVPGTLSIFSFEQRTGRSRWSAIGDPAAARCNNGTSFSTPLVTTLAAVMRAVNPGLQPGDLLKRIRQSQPTLTQTRPSDPRGGVDAPIAVAGSVFQRVTGKAPDVAGGQGAILTWDGVITKSRCDWGNVPRKQYGISCAVVPGLLPGKGKITHASKDDKGKAFTLEATWSAGGALVGSFKGLGVTPGIGPTTTIYTLQRGPQGDLKGTFTASSPGQKHPANGMQQNCTWSGTVTGSLFPTTNQNTAPADVPKPPKNP